MEFEFGIVAGVIAGAFLFITPIAISIAMLANLILVDLFRRRVDRSMRDTCGSDPTVTNEKSDIQTVPEGLDIQWIDVADKRVADFRVSPRLAEMRRKVNSTGVAYLSVSLIYLLILTFGFGLVSEITSLNQKIDMIILFFMVSSVPLVLVPTLAVRKQLRFLAAAVALQSVLFWCWAHFFSEVADPIRTWLLFAAAPTIAALILSTRRQRAVGPLVFSAILLLIYVPSAAVLTSVTYIITNFGDFHFAREDLAHLPIIEAAQQWFSEFFQMSIADKISLIQSFTNRPTDYARFETSQEIDGYDWIIWWIWLPALGLAIVLSALIVRWIARRYKQRLSSDQMASIDVLMVIFTIWMFLVLAAGWGWAAGVWALIGFVAYVVTINLLFRYRRQAEVKAIPRTLLFLRVFGFDYRTQRLLEDIGQHWRYAGPIRLIASTDVIHANIEPHEFLEFLNGRLSRAFVKNREDLENRIGAGESVPDPDGLYRTEDFFCHKNTWRMTVAKLALDADGVLMDLRGFGPDRQGCVFEIEQLLNSVSVGRIVFLTGDLTDIPYLMRVLEDAWCNMSVDSPNRVSLKHKLQIVKASSSHRKMCDTILGLLCEISLVR